MSYDRYKKFRFNGTVSLAHSVAIPVKDSDIVIEYKKGFTRLDNVSNEYYGDPNYDWLIMMANPEYGSMEFSIPNHALIRIPLPLTQTLQDYEENLDKYYTLYN